MLHALSKYATHKDLAAEPGFKAKQVKWAIVFDGSGRFVEVVELGDVGDPKNKGQTFKKCPDLSQPEMIAGGQTRSQFLIDTAEVVALFSKQLDAVKEDPTDTKIIAKHACFLEMLREASDPKPEWRAVADALADDDTLEKIRARLKQLKAKGTDKVALRVEGQFAVEQDWWRGWWQKYRESLSSTEKKPRHVMRCFVTGQLDEPAKTHPKVTGLASVGGQPSGDVLIGFDKDAFCSYGLAQSENAAVSQEAAAVYRAALDHLLKESSYVLGGSVKIVHWFKENVTSQDNPLDFLMEHPETKESVAQQRCRELLQSIESGRRPDLQANHYYAMTLSGASGRIMVRDWMEGTFAELVRNVLSWFDDLAITRPEGESLAKEPKFLAVLGSFVRDLKDLEPHGALVSKVWRAAIKGEAIPHVAQTQALHRFRSDIFEDKPFNPARMGLLRAYMLRKYRFQGGDAMANDLKPFLNENHPHPAYHAGRLLAVMAALQKRALGSVGAGIIQRYYAAASATPALVLGRLARTSQFHLSKLENENIANWYENTLANIWSRIESSLPRTLDLDEQSIFALGYYQQIAHMRSLGTRSEKTSEAKEGEDL